MWRSAKNYQYWSRCLPRTFYICLLTLELCHLPLDMNTDLTDLHDWQILWFFVWKINLTESMYNWILEGKVSEKKCWKQSHEHTWLCFVNCMSRTGQKICDTICHWERDMGVGPNLGWVGTWWARIELKLFIPLNHIQLACTVGWFFGFYERQIWTMLSLL